MNDPERYGTCSDGAGHWGIEDEGKLIFRGLISHDACDAVMDLLDERDKLRSEVARLTKAGDNLAIYAINRDKDLIITEVEAWNFAKEENNRERP